MNLFSTKKTGFHNKCEIHIFLYHLPFSLRTIIKIYCNLNGFYGPRVRDDIHKYSTLHITVRLNGHTLDTFYAIKINKRLSWVIKTDIRRRLQTN